MLKRMIAALLCLLLISAAIPIGATAATQAEEKRVLNEISDHYKKALAQAEGHGLGGYCGYMSSLQMYFMGINTYPQSNDGNKQYDYYEALEKTSGGYGITTYSCKDYTLEEALNVVSRHGTKDVYNILVGFQWTSTEAGAFYGHAVMIYAILNGMVYFTEGFATSMGTAAGEPIRISIADFARYYEDWTIFEGIVVFQKGVTAKAGAEYACNMLAETAEQTEVLSLDAVTGMGQKEESRVLRTVRSGERLLVTGLYKNVSNRFFYQVDDSGVTGYVPADKLIPEQFIWEGLCLQDVKLPKRLAKGEEFMLSGQLYGENCDVITLRTEIRNQDRELMQSHSMSKGSNQYDLMKENINPSLAFCILEEGVYEIEMYATYRNFYVKDGQLAMVKEEVSVIRDTFYVGVSAVKSKEAPASEESMPDGWFYRQGKLYCYQEGSPVTGWINYRGVDYYLRQDGSVTTDWAYINGKVRFFSNTGAMRTGWMHTKHGTYYFMEDGVEAQGRQIVDGKVYTFSDNGILQDPMRNNKPASYYRGGFSVS